MRQVCRGRAAHDPQGRQAHLFGDDAHAARAPARRQPSRSNTSAASAIWATRPRTSGSGRPGRCSRRASATTACARPTTPPSASSTDTGSRSGSCRFSTASSAIPTSGRSRRPRRGSPRRAPRRLQPRPAGRDRALAGAPSRARTAGLRQDRHPHRAHRRRAQGRREPLRHALPHVHEPSRARHEGAHRQALHGPVHGHPFYVGNLHRFCSAFSLTTTSSPRSRRSSTRTTSTT